MLRLLTITLLFSAVTAQAADPETFSSVLERTTRAQLIEVSEYLEAHPDAQDADTARRWMFATALDNGLEDVVAEAADAYLQRLERDPGLERRALSVRAVARVRAGQSDEAFVDLVKVIDGTGLRQAESALVVVNDLAAEFQIAGNVELATEAYEELGRKFFIHQPLRRLASNRLDKLDLVGKEPPAIELRDLEGNAIDLADHRGRVVLLDFWATNCAPCLAMFPRLRRLYAELHEQGFDIVGLSLDEDPEFVEQFAEEWKLDWPIALASEATALDYRAMTIPTLYVVDRDGRIAYSDVRGAKLEQVVRKLVEETK